MNYFNEWNEERLQQLITDEIEESLTLEFKAANALEKSDGKKKEITKDVSAMANSAGGVIIYGVKEYDRPDKRHLPERIDPVDRLYISKEWLEQVIGNIQPRISNITIFAVPISVVQPNDKVVYVVEVERSVLPHQASDKRYYKRYNFQNVMMEDYEINDIRNRRIVVESLVTFDIEIKYQNGIFFTIENPGSVPAHNVRFSFSREPKWHDNKTPSVFDKGIVFLPPGRKYSFFYRQFLNLLEDDTVPTSFDLSTSYFHPQLATTLEDVFHIDFSDFSQTIQLKSELKEHTEKMVKELSNLTKQLKEVQTSMKGLLRIAGPSGLQLSDTTLQNLKHIANRDDNLEKLDPDLFPLNSDIYCEMLGIDRALANDIAWYFYRPTPGLSLREMEGMTNELYAKINLLFRIEEEEEE